MPWLNPRSRRVPSNWRAIRKRILWRDQCMCQIVDDGCLFRATEVDHIVNNDDHSDANLRAVCAPCHKNKTKREARVGIIKANQRGKRPIDPHPGAI